MYAYPERITDDFIAAMKRNEKVLPYLDLPIQHCNAMSSCKNMNRRSNRAELLERHSTTAPRDPRHHPAHHPDRGLPRRDRGAV